MSLELPRDQGSPEMYAATFLGQHLCQLAGSEIPPNVP